MFYFFFLLVYSRARYVDVKDRASLLEKSNDFERTSPRQAILCLCAWCDNDSEGGTSVYFSSFKYPMVGWLGKIVFVIHRARVVIALGLMSITLVCDLWQFYLQGRPA